MLGICKKCGKPLFERYNGQLFCARCGQDVILDPLRITKENESSFKLSELCFLRYLSPMKGTLAVNDKRQLLADAVRICKESANSGHPKAIFRMGYYNQYFLEREISEAERMRRAFEHYWRLCDTKNTTEYYSLADNKYLSETLTSADEYTALKKQAAVNILEMFSKYPAVFKTAQSTDNRYKRAKRELLTKYGSQIGLREYGEYSKAPIVKEIYNVLSSCFSDKRPALFGIFHLSAEELKELLSIKANPEKGIKYDASIICEKLRFCYMVCDKNGRADMSRQTEFNRIRQAEFPTEFIRDNDNILFAFLNKDGKHKYLSKKRADKALDRIYEDGFLIDLIGKTSKKEIILYDDDIIWLEKVLKGDFDDLSENIAQEG